MNKYRVPKIPPLLVNNRFILNCSEKAKLFNDFFSKLCTPHSSSCFLLPLNLLSDKRIYHITVQRGEITSLIPNLNPRSQQVLMGFLVKCDNSVALPLKIMFRTFWKLPYTLPDTWKLPYTLPDMWKLPYTLPDMWKLPYTLPDMWKLPYTLPDMWELPYTLPDMWKLPYTLPDMWKLPYTLPDMWELPYTLPDMWKLPYTLTCGNFHIP